MARTVNTSTKQPDLLDVVDHKPAIPAQRSHTAWRWVDWMPDLDDPIRAAHEQTWGLTALAGAVAAGGATWISVDEPELGVWLAALLGAFGGMMLLPLVAILVRLSIFLVLAGVVGGAVAAGFGFFSE